MDWEDNVIKRLEVIMETQIGIQDALKSIMEFLSAHFTAVGEKEQFIMKRGSGYHEPCPSDLPRGSADSKPIVKEEKVYKVSPGFPQVADEVVVDGYKYENFKLCKYGCGYLVSWNVKEKSYAHFTIDKKYIGMYCPKFE